MNIYLSHASSLDYEHNLYGPLKSSDIARKHQLFLPHDLVNINTDSKNSIKQADLVVAVLSYPSTGQGIELGLASANNIPVVCLCKIGSKVSGSLRFVTQDVIEYKDVPDMILRLGAWLGSK